MNNLKAPCIDVDALRAIRAVVCNVSIDLDALWAIRTMTDSAAPVRKDGGPAIFNRSSFDNLNAVKNRVTPFRTRHPELGSGSPAGLQDDHHFIDLDA